MDDDRPAAHPLGWLVWPDGVVRLADGSSPSGPEWDAYVRHIIGRLRETAGRIQPDSPDTDNRDDEE